MRFVNCLSHLLLLLLSAEAQKETCSSEDGTCKQDDADSGTSCESPFCSDTSTDLYRHGASAQAYKPNTPIKHNVCEKQKGVKHKVASWPYWRGTSWTEAASLNVHLDVWSCTSSEDAGCCCEPLVSNTTKVEVWQARPDGTYSSLHAGQNDGDCRATLPMGETRFHTLAPGATGIFQGLGPSKWDFAPYGPPVIHLLVQAVDHKPLLVDLPLFYHKHTLEERTFRWPDFRGVAWMRHTNKKHSTPFEITSWTPDLDNASIDVQVRVFVTKDGSSIVSPTDLFCQSFVYGFPGSFFLEPISLCGPSLLDYFNL